MRLYSMKLRGAIGIKEGTGQDMVEIDFNQFGEGLIAVVGGNGSGKTTLIENLHPFRCLASREGKLQDHFYLRDSYRELKFSIGDDVYTSKLLIDALSGNMESYLFKNNLPINDGKNKTYDEEIVKILGSQDLYFKSIFSAQGARGITVLTSAKRKELFLELLGLQKYEIYESIVKIKISDLEIALVHLNDKIDEAAGKTDQKEAITAMIGNAAQAITGNSIKHHMLTSEKENIEAKTLEIRLKMSGNEVSLKRKRELIDKRHRIVYESKEHSTKTSEQASAIQIKIDGFNVKLKRLNEIASHREDILQKNLQGEELKVLDAQMSSDKTHMLEVMQSNSKRIIEYQIEFKNHQSKVTSAGNQKAFIEREYESETALFLEKSSSMKKQISDEEKESALIGEVPCGVPMYEPLSSTCILLSNARGATKRTIEWDEKLHALSESFAVRESYLIEEIDKYRIMSEELIANNPERPMEQSVPAYDPARHKSILDKIDEIKKGNWEKLKEELAGADIAIESIIETSKSLSDQIDVLRLASQTASKNTEIEISDIGIEIASIEIVDYSEQMTNQNTMLSLKNVEIVSVADENTKLSSTVMFGEKQLQEIDNLVEMTKGWVQAKADTTDNLSEYKYLQRAFSKSGIPALELDASAVEISTIANELLSQTFGSAFQLQFETIKPSADGKKQIETFDIKIFTENGHRDIEDLSGGQRIWIEKALQESFSIYLTNQSGRTFETSFSDESDGALDADNKQNYLNMLRESAKMAHRQHTFIITQTPEIYSQIEQKIILSKKGIVVES